MRTFIVVQLLLGALCPSARAETYVEEHTRLVMSSFMLFSTVSPPERQVNAVEIERDKDRLQIFKVIDSRAVAQQTSYGMMMFGAATFMAAHAPDPLRKVLSGPLRLGPAVFEGGGMGAGIGGRFL